MGFAIDTETKFDDLGLTLSGCYYSFKGNCRINRYIEAENAIKYNIYGHYDVYASKATYTDGGVPLKKKCGFNCVVNSLDNVEPVTKLYTDLKTQLKMDLSITDADITDYA